MKAERHCSRPASMSRAEIMKAALELAEEERELLVEELVVSLHGGSADGGLSPPWEAEIARRLRKAESGEATYVSAEEVFPEADEMVRAARGAR
jgi:putative addiction module component (TIGR02574 family)